MTAAPVAETDTTGGLDPHDGRHGSDEREPHSQLAGRLATMMHSMGRFRHQLANRNGGEVATNVLLFALVKHGPQRTGVLAEHLDSDPSTISRQVAALVKAGLIERQADPEDGRASLLAATETGVQCFRSQMTRRDQHFRQMLSDWDDGEVAAFTDYIERFTTAFDDYKHVILADVDVAEPATGSASPAAAGREEN